MRPPAFLLDAPKRGGQQAQKSLKAQGPGEWQGLSTPLASNNSSVVHRHKRCSISSSAYCGVPISGRSQRQTTMYDIDTTEQRNGSEETMSGIVKKQRMVRVVFTTGGLGSPQKPQDVNTKIESGEPGEPQSTIFSYEGQENGGEKNTQYKEKFSFGVHRVHHPSKNSVPSGVLSGEPLPGVVNTRFTNTSGVTQ